MEELLIWLVLTAIVIVPMWRMFERSGNPPALALLVLIPGLGVWIAAYLLAFMRWPAAVPDGER